MTKQTKAQQLADEHEVDEWIATTRQWRDEAAAELRRLDALTHIQLLRIAELEGDLSEHRRLEALAFKQHDKIKSLLTINAQLLEMLEDAAEAFEIAADSGGVNFHEYAKESRAAIAAAKEQA